MLEEIYDNLAKYDVQIIYAPFHKEGFYDPHTNNIYISDSVQSPCRRKNLILHEAAHAFLHFNELALYEHCIFAHNKMEHEANVFRINSLVREYVSEYGIDHGINIYDFMAFNKISSVNEDDVRAAFVSEEYQQKNSQELSPEG